MKHTPVQKLLWEKKYHILIGEKGETKVGECGGKTGKHNYVRNKREKRGIQNTER